MFFVMKWQMLEKVFYFLSIIVDKKTSICTRLCLFVPDNSNFETFYNEINLKNGVHFDINAIKDASTSKYVYKSL